MAKIINLGNEVKASDTIINELLEVKTDIKDLVVFVTLKEQEVAYISHTGLSLSQLALACKMLDKEFMEIIDLQEMDR